MIRRHARPFHAHPQPQPISPYAFTLAEFVLVGIAAIVAAPLTYAFIVLALTTLGGTR